MVRFVISISNYLKVQFLKKIKLLCLNLSPIYRYYYMNEEETKLFNKAVDWQNDLLLKYNIHPKFPQQEMAS